MQFHRPSDRTRRLEAAHDERIARTRGTEAAEAVRIILPRGVLHHPPGQEYSASIFDAVEPELGSPKIQPGDQRLGWITFEVPLRARLRMFQFTLNSGFGPETGEWTLPS
jgi:hypothetical protein